MKRISRYFLLGTIFLPVMAFATDSSIDESKAEDSVNPEATPSDKPPASMQNLANQANNPTVPLTVIQFRNITAFDTPGLDGTGNLAELTAVLPLKPFKLFKVPTITKITVPYLTIPDPVNQSGFGNFQIFSQAVYNKKWGSFAVGAVAVVPSSTASNEGQTIQVGPAAGFMYTGVKQLIAGAILQNPISVNAGPNDTKTNSLAVAPTLTYNLSSGWFAGMSDFNWTFDWENGGAATIPLGLQVGRIFKIDKQAFSLSVEAGYTVIKPDEGLTPRYLVGIEFSALFPEVL